MTGNIKARLCCILVVITLALGSVNADAVNDRPFIIYTGLRTAGGPINSDGSHNNFPYLLNNDYCGASACALNQLKKIIDDILFGQRNDFNFDFVLPHHLKDMSSEEISGTEAVEVAEIKNELCMSILINGEYISHETFNVGRAVSGSDQAKYFLDVSLCAIFYYPAGKTKNKIEFSIPVTYETSLFENVSNEKSPEMRQRFLKTFKAAADVLMARIKQLDLRMITCAVTDVSGNTAVINIGKSAGVIPGLSVRDSKGNIYEITKADENSAAFNTRGAGIALGETMSLVASKALNIRETYQVAATKATTSKAGEITSGGPSFLDLCAQRYSDYLSERGGVVVLPPKGANYVEVNEEVFLGGVSSLDLKKWAEQEFEGDIIPITLNIKGLGKGLVKESSVNQVWGYKAIVEEEVNGIKREVSEVMLVEVIPGRKEVTDADCYKEVIFQALAKMARQQRGATP